MRNGRARYPWLVNLLWLVGAAVAFLALIWLFQRRLIYIPLPQDVTPAAVDLPGSSEESFETADGLRLGGWFLPAPRPGQGPGVVVFNGNAGNRSFRAPLARALSRAGLSVLLFDYRGYGGNDGRPTERGLQADARAARAFLESRPQVDPQRIVYFGESLGAGVAVGLAVEHPPAALVLRSPFTSLADVGRVHYPFLPVRTLLRDRYPSLDRIGRLSCPLLVVAGERDRIVPASQSRKLYDAAPEPKRFVLLPGVDHNDLEMLGGPRLMAELESFLAETVGQ